MTTTTQAIMQRCWEECTDNPSARECDFCPAHSSKNGDCCYGQWESGHQSCVQCPHEEDCRDDTLRGEMVMDSPRRIHIQRQPSSATTSRRLPIYGSQNRGTLLNQPNHEREIVRPQEDIMTLGDKIKQFMTDLGIRAAWGAAEGALEMVQNYMRNRRPWESRYYK